MHDNGFRSIARVILGFSFLALWVIASAVFAGFFEAVCQACLPAELKAMLFAVVGLAVAGSGSLVIWHRHRNLFEDPQAGPHHP
ncbi:MAG TPA: hypothetical protein QGF63_01040 [Alphaproteobacteria bacterium]|jgi:hypothetical protein|nr:hypothetical protein [Alphaproteobacteria bacterium]MDP6268914.1 hypothetical protein [Alphaproteobacteria bacterium]MDP7429072.1 hypothetical protein [Alphaproteobacteria bacterium]HJM48409.1 hypothetical protein [Alphaproteobacteria bacterium]|tara:strand:- start:611 stop:862 length:252 start_codon:yes stop_codon:yes gene_type:complete